MLITLIMTVIPHTVFLRLRHRSIKLLIWSYLWLWCLMTTKIVWCWWRWANHIHITTRDQFISFHCFGWLHCQPLHHQEHHRRGYRLGGWSPQCWSKKRVDTGCTSVHVRYRSVQVCITRHYMWRLTISNSSHIWANIASNIEEQHENRFWRRNFAMNQQSGQVYVVFGFIGQTMLIELLKGAQTCMLHCTCMDGLCIYICIYLHISILFFKGCFLLDPSPKPWHWMYPSTSSKNRCSGEQETNEAKVAQNNEGAETAAYRYTIVAICSVSVVTDWLGGCQPQFCLFICETKKSCLAYTCWYHCVTIYCRGIQPLRSHTSEQIQLVLTAASWSLEWRQGSSSHTKFALMSLNKYIYIIYNI